LAKKSRTKINSNREERIKMNNDPMFKMNWHHSDCSGEGPGDLYVDRLTHEIIHQTNAQVLRDFSIPARGFCGDSFTLKGNNLKID
jgi:hypothetical protein